MIRYPHLDSVIPTSIPYGVFTGLLYRRYRICTRKTVFLKNAVELAMSLRDKRYSQCRLCNPQYSFSEGSTKMELLSTIFIQALC